MFYIFEMFPTYIEDIRCEVMARQVCPAHQLRPLAVSVAGCSGGSLEGLGQVDKHDVRH